MRLHVELCQNDKDNAEPVEQPLQQGHQISTPALPGLGIGVAAVLDLPYFQHVACVIPQRRGSRSSVVWTCIDLITVFFRAIIDNGGIGPESSLVDVVVVLLYQLLPFLDHRGRLGRVWRFILVTFELNIIYDYI